MEQQRTIDSTTNFMKKNRPKSSFLSWIVHNKKSTVATTGEETDTVHDSEKLEISDQSSLMNSSYSTPTATGSYTHLDNVLLSSPPPPPPKDNTHKTTAPNIIIDSRNCDTNTAVKIPDRRQSNLYTPFHNPDPTSYKRRSYYASNLAPIDASISNSSLSRSATWQPTRTSSSTLCVVPTDIPTRRTSRNYTSNPEIQAKLNDMLNSDRTLYLSTVIHNNAEPSNINRRSTTPGNRLN